MSHAKTVQNHKSAKLSCVSFCVTVFILLCDRGRQGSVLKRTKNDHFQVFLAVWVFFLRFLGRLRGDLC